MNLVENFDNFYKSFEDKFRGSREDILNRLKFYRPILDGYKNKVGNFRLLDVGCGRCEFLELAKEYSDNIRGVDLSKSLTKECLDKGLEVFVGDGVDFLKSQADGSFDLLTAFHFIEHLDLQEMLEFIRQSYRVLSEKGCIILEFPYIHSYKVISHFSWLDPTHRRPLDPHFLSFVLSYFGFSQVFTFNLKSVEPNTNTIHGVLESSPMDVALVAFKNRDFSLEFEKEISAMQESSLPSFFELVAHYDNNLHIKLNTLHDHISDINVRLSSSLNYINNAIQMLSQGLEETNRRLEDVNVRLYNIENSKLMRFYGYIVKIKRMLTQKLKFKRGSPELKYGEEKVYSSTTGGNRLVYISPFPPQKSGISYYSLDLVWELANFYEVVIVTDEKDVAKSLKDSFPVYGYKDLLSGKLKFDRLLIHMGNNPLHSKMLDVLYKFGGVVVLHDFFIPDLYYNYKDKETFLRELYYSHGLTPLYQLKTFGLRYILENYPMNMHILNKSKGVIVHSKFAKSLTDEFYSVQNPDKIEVVNFPVKVKEFCYKEKGETFHIASFGFINSSKGIVEIIEAFAGSQLLRSKGKLTFVGEFVDQSYKDVVFESIRKYKLEDVVTITGFVSEEKWEDIVRDVDVAVQLRTISRGETSKAVFDLLASGKPVVVNEKGSFSELPEGVVYKIPAEFSVESLREALERLYTDDTLRKSISQSGYEYIKNYHSPEYVASSYRDVVEKFYTQATGDRPFASKILFVDISSLITDDHKTGIQRVMKAQLKNLIINPPEGYRVEPVYLSDKKNGLFSYYYGRKFIREFMDIEIFDEDEEVWITKDDILYIPDYNAIALNRAYLQGLFKRIEPGRIVSLVYDILPIKHPEFFPKGTDTYHRIYIDIISNISDKIICISERVMDELNIYLSGRQKKETLILDFLHLGSDFVVAKHFSSSSEENINRWGITPKRYFLMVSTIEPRKGFEDILNAFEQLWENGFEYQLVFVGKKGWMVENLIKRIKTHPQLNRKLFWLGQVSDTTLEHLYNNALATIVASKDEGFGLAIVESALYGVPVIARDIPVFREVGGEGVFYFPDTQNPEDISNSILSWIELNSQGKIPDPKSIKVISWQEHTEILKQKIVS